MNGSMVSDPIYGRWARLNRGSKKSWRMAPNQVSLLAYLHFGSGLGIDRLCAGTVTVFGPGLPVVRVGRHFTLLTIYISSFLRRVPLPIGNLQSRTIYMAVKSGAIRYDFHIVYWAFVIALNFSAACNLLYAG